MPVISCGNNTTVMLSYIKYLSLIFVPGLVQKFFIGNMKALGARSRKIHLFTPPPEYYLLALGRFALYCFSFNLLSHE